MGLFDKIFGHSRPEVQRLGDYKALTAYQPVFTSSSGRIYESELIRAAIHARATHVSKLKVEFSGVGSVALSNRIGRRPNTFQTWGQLLYRISSILDIHNTAFVVPEFDNFDRVVGIHVVSPTQCTVVGEDTRDPYLAFRFRTGEFVQLPVWQVATLTKFQNDNDFFGSDNAALKPTLDLINIQNQGIVEGVKSAATFRFMAQVNNFVKPSDLSKEQQRYTDENLSAGGGGLLLFPNTYTNIQQINSKPFVVDQGQMQQIRENVFEYFGVNSDVLMNKAFGDAWSAFYEGAVEPFAIQLSDVLTDLFVALGELRGDCSVTCTSNRLQFMTTADKLAVSKDLSDRGVLNRDEVREIWNLAPLPDGEGTAYIIRGEYHNADQHINGDDEESDDNAGET